MSAPERARATSAKPHRGTIFVEDGEIVEVRRYPGEQYILRITAPRCAATARAGTFAHITCDAGLPMRRPLSLMRVDADRGWIEVLFKTVGQGLRALAGRRCGDRVSVLGPIGRPFEPHPERPHALLVGGGVGIPPMIFLAEALAGDERAWQPLVLMGSEIPFPFAAAKSAFDVPGAPASATHGMPLVEDWGIPSRLASAAGIGGAFDGFVTELADRWLAAQPADVVAATEMFACGPTPMLRAAAVVAARHDVPCQVSLEEYMACAVGGCAGCTVLVQTDAGPAMKRVCVDGPVFDSRQVFPDA